MLRSLVVVAFACIVSQFLPANAQGTSKLDTGSRLSILVSRGTTANIFDLNADLVGVPANPFELRKGEIFPIEAGKLVLAFLDQTVMYNGLKRTMILTEDGQWGVAQLKSESGRDYFIDGSAFKNQSSSESVAWGIITSDILLRNENIILSMGEAVRIVGRESEKPKLRFAKDDLITGTKYNDIKAKANQTNNVSIVNDSQIDVTFDRDQLNHINFIPVGNIQYFLNLGQPSGRFFNWARETPEVFKEWRKTIKLGAPFRVTCADKIERKEEKKADARVDVSTKINADLSKLSIIGVKIEASADASAEWNYSHTSTEELKGISLDVDTYLVSAQQAVFGNGFDCATQIRYFTATVPGVISESPISEKEMDNIVKSIQHTAIEPSGHIVVSCFSAYRAVDDYFDTQLDLGDALSGFFASHILRIATPDLRQFYKC